MPWPTRPPPLAWYSARRFADYSARQDKTARIIVQHRFERQETPWIQCQLRQSLVAGLAIQPILYGTLCLKWSSVLELCCVTLQIRTQALPLRARISLTCWYVHVHIKNLKLPTQRSLWCVELHRQVKQTDMSISYRRLLKPKSAIKL